MIVDAPVKESESHAASGMNQSMMGGMGGFKLEVMRIYMIRDAL